MQVSDYLLSLIDSAVGGMTLVVVLVSVVFLVLGFVMLIKGADMFVDGASKVALKLKVPLIVVGLTIVAFGTSAPEAAISITSACQDNAGIAVGNVIGSNIMNILIILGISALFAVLPEGTVVIGYPGCAAAEYADQYGFIYQQADTLHGDINGDGRCSKADITMMLAIMTEYNLLDPDRIAPARADLNGDGILDLLDLRELQKLLNAADTEET